MMLPEQRRASSGAGALCPPVRVLVVCQPQPDQQLAGGIGAQFKEFRQRIRPYPAGRKVVTKRSQRFAFAALASCPPMTGAAEALIGSGLLKTFVTPVACRLFDGRLSTPRNVRPRMGHCYHSRSPFPMNRYRSSHKTSIMGIMQICQNGASGRNVRRQRPDLSQLGC